MLFLLISKYLDNKNIYTFFPQLLYILLEPNTSLTFINVSLITVILISLFKRKDYVSFKSLLIIYFVALLNLYLKNSVNNYIFILIIFFIGIILIKKKDLSLIIILQLLCAYVLIILIDNPIILGILFSVYKFNSNLYHEIGINALLLVLSSFLGRLLIDTNDIMMGKVNMYLLIFVIGLGVIKSISKKGILKTS